ncbi:MAG: TIGR02281 family clan AA aspartic protease [Cypionkella sp.]|uniref:retropepsin-like aspartic protease family protein n=1 Tax=Cypionkella sp. TaxID=2811411 RepID=UPI002ABB15FC|nr:TIGR02281 family clan AA aspartic protease [Cypionkella sp.]MDZ4312799.1 TIGR02281 family clan AA aspartic protease [Cypionkella sp.]
MNGDDFGRLAYLALLLAAVGGWVMVEYRQRLGQALRVALAWGLIFVGLMAGYGLWNDLQRDIRSAQVVQGGRVEIPRAPDGHYYLRLAVDGHEMEFMVDTGATGIVLSPDDATAVGIELSSLDYLGQAVTANGVVRTARVSLDSVVLGPFEDEGVTAFVNEAAMQGSLLGMDYLGRFSIQISGDRMILTR